MNNKRLFPAISTHVILLMFSLVMIFPLIWMFMASFKTNAEIFGSLKLLPQSFNLDAFINGWQGVGNIHFGIFFQNSFYMTAPTVIFTVISCSLVAYGFARFQFPLKGLLFSVMIATLMLPNSVIVIPRYLIFNKLGWLDSYLPFIVPAIFACYPFFIFMLVQFIRGIPKEIDESAKIDGCTPVGIFFRVLMPLMKPALFSAGLLQLMWTWNDFFDVLIYIDSVRKYPLALGIRMSMDSASAIQWNEVMAMAMLSIIPLIIIFFFAQKSFVEGISTTGLKG